MASFRSCVLQFDEFRKLFRRTDLKEEKIFKAVIRGHAVRSYQLKECIIDELTPSGRVFFVTDHLTQHQLSLPILSLPKYVTLDACILDGFRGREDLRSGVPE